MGKPRVSLGAVRVRNQQVGELSPASAMSRICRHESSGRPRPSSRRLPRPVEFAKDYIDSWGGGRRPRSTRYECTVDTNHSARGL